MKIECFDHFICDRFYVWDTHVGLVGNRKKYTKINTFLI